MEWIQAHYHEVLEVFGAVVAVISLIVKLFATDKTKGVWAKILKVLAALSLVNPDGSIVGKKAE
jgi:hypothetical protein